MNTMATTTGLVPEIVDAPPKETIKLVYPSGVSASLGNELTPTQVKDEPTVSWTAESGALYLLAAIDPDAPSKDNPAIAQIVHHLVANIPGCDVSKGDVFFEYIGAGPPKDTGLHRYIWLIFKQSGKIAAQPKVPKTSIKGRFKFDVRKFASANGCGNPVAGNFYVAQYDDYVPIAHASMSDS